MKNIYCIIGESGTGKTTIAETLCKRHNLTELNSYTTRPQRYPDERGHTFVTGLTFDQIKEQFPERVAETIFDGNMYWATRQQIDESDLYVIDPYGVGTLKANYHGWKNIRVIYLKCPKFERVRRMRKRGDTDEQIEARIKHDEAAFADAMNVADTVIYNDMLDRGLLDVWAYILECEGV